MNPHGEGGQEGTVSDEERHESAHIGPGGQNPEGGEGRNEEESGHEKPISGHKKCDLCVTCDGIPEDLKKVIRAWTGLTDGEKAQILGMVASDEG